MQDLMSIKTAHPAVVPPKCAVAQELGADVNVDNKNPIPQGHDHGNGCGCGNQNALQGIFAALGGSSATREGFREFTTPLHMAAERGYLEMVKLLLNHGAKVDAFDIDDGTPLTCGVGSNSFEVCKILLEWPGGLGSIGLKQKQGHLPIHYAGNGNPEVLKLLLGEGAEADVPVDQEGSWAHGGTALSAACKDRSPTDSTEEIVKILLDAGADPNRQLRNKSTPFLLALDSGNTKAARVILERGAADLASLATVDVPPLFVAATKGRAEICKLLIEAGCDVNLKTTDGDEYTPLHNAAGYGSNKETIMVLLSAGADIEAQNYDGRRPLHMACFKGQVVCARELINSGADIESKDDSSWTPLHFAARYGHIEVVRLLLNPDSNAKVALLNKRTTGGPGGEFYNCTAADLAKSNSHIEIIQLLVDAGDTLTSTH